MVTEAPTPLNDVSQGALIYLRRTNRIKKNNKTGLSHQRAAAPEGSR